MHLRLGLRLGVREVVRVRARVKVRGEGGLQLELGLREG